jgi:hypothetical protein
MLSSFSLSNFTKQDAIIALYSVVIVYQDVAIKKLRAQNETLWADVVYLTDMLNKNGITLDAFDEIALNHVQKRHREENMD